MTARSVAAVLMGLLLGGCISSTPQPTPESALKPRDKQLLANAPYPKVKPEGMFARQIVTYEGKEKPGTIVVDTDKKLLYYVQGDGTAIRYGVTVGEESLACRGEAKVGRKAEWPSWTPTAEIHQRIAGLPSYVCPGPHNPMGSRPR